MNKNQHFTKEVDYKVNSSSLTLTDILEDIINNNLIHSSTCKVTHKYVINLIIREYAVDHDTAYHISNLVKYYLPRLFKN
jgi:hypothetical protein